MPLAFLDPNLLIISNPDPQHILPLNTYHCKNSSFVLRPVPLSWPLFPLVGQWSEIERKAEGEKVPDIEEDEVELRRRNDHNYRAFKSSRMPYTRQDQQEIVKHLGKFSPT